MTDLDIPLYKRIQDLETLRVLVNPLRLQILEHVHLMNRDGKLVTVKQIADQLQQPITKLYYHINLMEEHDLIRVEETRVVSGILEKHYRVSAQRLTLDQDLFGQTNDSNTKKEIVLSLVESILERTFQSLNEWANAQQAEKVPPEIKDQNIHMSRELVRINGPQAKEFHQRLSELVREYESLTPEDPAAPTFTFGLTTLFYPVIDEGTHPGEPDQEPQT